MAESRSTTTGGQDSLCVRVPSWAGVTCAVDGCDLPVESKGQCAKHADRRRYYEQKERSGWVDKRLRWKGVTCSADDCTHPARARGLCTSHYTKSRWDAGYGRPTKEAQRRGHLRHRYGIDVEDYERLLAEQDGVCAICKRAPTPENTRRKGVLFVDHCHDSRAIRGLLCNDCNLIIGHGATTERLLAAAEYMRIRG